jgi:hypothetical protein
MHRRRGVGGEGSFRHGLPAARRRAGGEGGQPHARQRPERVEPSRVSIPREAHGLNGQRHERESRGPQPAVDRSAGGSPATGSFFACTGFLVSAQSHFLSNQHCISTQASVDSLEVRFNFENATCGGDVLKPFDTFLGDQLVVTGVKFDFALMTLQGNPSATYGFLPLSPRGPALNENLYLPQHPQAGPKKVSVDGCLVSAVKLDEGAPGSDFGHQCDTQPGSSGSPVLDLDNRVVGLHHVGDCTAFGGQNKAVLMSKILPLLPLPEEFLAGGVGCGGNSCVDTWKIGCASPYTSCVVAHACAEGSDSTLALTLLAYAPTGITGRGEIASGAPGGCTPDVRICRDSAGAMKAVMMLSAPAGATNYTAFVGCEDRSGALLSPGSRSVDVITDQ